MRLSIGGIFAKCPACEGNDFEPVIRLTSETRDVFVCARCRTRARYTDLELQIGQEAVRRARLARQAARPS
jgi:hypothetical protein